MTFLRLFLKLKLVKICPEEDFVFKSYQTIFMSQTVVYCLQWQKPKLFTAIAYIHKTLFMFISTEYKDSAEVQYSCFLTCFNSKWKGQSDPTSKKMHYSVLTFHFQHHFFFNQFSSVCIFERKKCKDPQKISQSYVKKSAFKILKSIYFYTFSFRFLGLHPPTRVCGGERKFCNKSEI